LVDLETGFVSDFGFRNGRDDFVDLETGFVSDFLVDLETGFVTDFW
jgi:hypothetical protein